MSYISSLNGKANVFSSKTFYPYTDKIFNYEVDNLTSNYKSDYFFNAIDLLINLYKKEIKKFTLESKFDEYKYIVPIPYNIEKFNNLNIEICKNIVKHTDLEMIEDFFISYDVPSVDIRDRFFDENVRYDFVINDKYKNYNIIFYDTFVSSALLFDKISSFMETLPIFLNYFIRVDSAILEKSKITDIRLIERKIQSNKSESHVVKIFNLFNKKDITVDLRDDIAIIIGDNGVGKSTAYRIATLASSDNIFSRVKLLKCFFEKIEVYYADANGIVNKKYVITYNDLLPKKEALINITNDEKYYSSHFYMLDSKVLPKKFNASKSLIDANIFLTKIDDIEYVNLYKKILLDDFTYRYDVSKLQKKYKFENINLDNVFIFLKHIVSLNIKFYEFNDLILTPYTLYISFTKNRNIKPYLPKIMFKNNNDYYYDYINNKENEEMYNEDYLFELYENKKISQDKGNLFYDDYYLKENDMLNDDYGNYEWDALYDSVAEEEKEAKKRREEEKKVRNEFELFFKLKWDIEDYYSMLFENKKTIVRYDYYKILKSNENVISLSEEEKNADLLKIKNSIFNNNYEYELKKKTFSEISSKFNKEYYYNKNLSSLYDFAKAEIDLNKIVKTINKDKIKKVSNFLSLNFDSLDENVINTNDINELNNEIFIKRNNDLNFGILEILDENSKTDLIRSLKLGSNKEKENLLFFIKNYLDNIMPKHIDDGLKKAEYIINKYLYDKKVKIYPKNVVFLDAADNIIPSSALSSGEKNIVFIVFISCLLNKIFSENSNITTKNSFNLVIDEPDISMSISWQEDLIEDIMYLLGDNIKINILTQSPQLVQNEQLHPYVYNLLDREFIVNNSDELLSESFRFRDNNVYGEFEQKNKKIRNINTDKKNYDDCRLNDNILNPNQFDSDSFFEESSDIVVGEVFNEIEFDDEKEIDEDDPFENLLKVGDIEL